MAAVRGDACLIGESSGTWSAGIGEKGVLWLRLRASGVSGHAAYQQGTSAVAAVRAAVAAVEGLHGRRGKTDKAVRAVITGQRRAAERRWGRGTGRLADTVAVSVGTPQGGGQVNLIPAAAIAELDLRVPPGCDDGRDRARGPLPDRAGDARQGWRWTSSTSAIPT